jgi:tellurite methyltransferase
VSSRWDQKYRDGYGAGATVEPLVASAVASLRAGIALDLACGSGRNALYLAARGWHVTALDYSAVAIEMLSRRSEELGLSIDVRRVDLEDPAYQLSNSEYDLIVDVLYLQRTLFSQIRSAVKTGGTFVGVMAMADDDPEVAPMNPEYLCAPDELGEVFAGWRIHHYREGKPERDGMRRRVAEIIAERLSEEQKPATIRKSP